MNEENTFIGTINLLFADKNNIDIICAIYDKHLNVKTISSLLELEIGEVLQRLESLLRIKMISKTMNGNGDLYFLKEPKICESILMFKDAFYRLDYIDNRIDKEFI